MTRSRPLSIPFGAAVLTGGSAACAVESRDRPEWKPGCGGYFLPRCLSARVSALCCTYCCGFSCRASDLVGATTGGEHDSAPAAATAGAGAAPTAAPLPPLT